MRTIRTRSTVVATAALLAGLSLTACQNDDPSRTPRPAGSGKASAAPEIPASTPAPGTAGGTASGSTTGDRGQGTGGTAGRSTGGGSGDTTGGGGGDSSPTTCTGDTTKVVVSKVSRPINHLLLTVTNTGSRDCAAYHAPLLRFDDEQSATRVIDDSKPQAVVTLAPGQAAYASITLSAADGSGSNGRTAKRLTVHFAPRDGSGSTGAPAELTLPAGTHKDDNAAVTYWQSDMADALTY
ncbi:DUF4232 domain-containing protein [Streptomyces sp. NPDC007988]|uniref:DUF4232 domain-containing protein n=1 Tax=Streptomyces sp. NPDC007988 TaxID=3364802 RepID=UPI0036EB74E6